MKNSGVKRIGLTGGIGSGKSTVSDYLKGRGFAVIDADKIAREIVAPGSPVLAELASVFGTDILDGDGALERKKLAGVVFADSALRERLDAITHREIAAVMERQSTALIEAGANVIFFDIPLLFESKEKLSGKLDEIWLVDAPEELRIERVAARDGISREEIQNRMKNQMGSDEKRKKSHKVIENSGSEEELYLTLDKLIGNI